MNEHTILPMNFKEYLQNKKYSDNTVTRYNKGIQRFLLWLREEALQPENFTYNDLLDFMRYCHNKGISKISLHNLLCIIRHYCNYLIGEKQRTDNPAAGVFIKGLSRKLPSSLLSMEDMEELYRQYCLQLNVDASKKIMLGLMIYQGLNVGEIMRLQHHHIRIKEGKIFIKGTKRTNERLLNLHVLQMPMLQEYLSANKFKDGALFSEKRRNEVSPKNIGNRIVYMLKQLRQLNSKVIDTKQIHSSVITEWLRKNNLRQVQYMAGHKYVSSTERYRLNNLEELQNELKEHHPMK